MEKSLISKNRSRMFRGLQVSLSFRSLWFGKWKSWVSQSPCASLQEAVGHGTWQGHLVSLRSAFGFLPRAFCWCCLPLHKKIWWNLSKVKFRRNQLSHPSLMRQGNIYEDSWPLSCWDCPWRQGRGVFGGEEGESRKHIKQTKVIDVMGHAMINSVP